MVSFEPETVVCARCDDGTEVVRYTRTGRWYAHKPGAKAQRLTLDEAARLVRAWRAAGVGDLIEGTPGAGHLSRKVHAAGVRSRL